MDMAKQAITRFTTKLQPGGCPEATLIGNKAHTLCQLLAVGYSVPAAVVVHTTAFRAFLNKNHIIRHLRARLSLLANPDFEWWTEYYTYVQHLFHQGLLPDSLAWDVKEAVAQLGLLSVDSHHCYSVRSSATIEDKPPLSFAGCFDTYLDVDARDVPEAMRKCWASMFSIRAMAYRARRSLSYENGDMAVIIQRMVYGKSTGALCTVHPVTKRGDVVIIEGHVPQSGEASGDIAYRLLVHRDTLTLVEKRDVATSVVPEELACQLAQIGLSIEETLGGPQYVEWVIDKSDKVWILQARPVGEHVDTKWDYSIVGREP